MSATDLCDNGLFIGYFIYEGIYFACGLVFEDQYSNALSSKNKNFNIIKLYNNKLEDRILLMSNTQLIKSFLVIASLVIYGIVLYFGYLYSSLDMLLIKLNLKKVFSYYYHILMIIIADIVPFLFIYPFISDFTSCLCMPVHWNTSQYLIIYAIILKIFSDNFSNKSFINSILFSIISFCIYVYAFSNFFFTRNSAYTNYFNDKISILIFFFAPMMLFIKEYSIQKILINTEINSFAFIFIIWILEEIIYLILRIYFISIQSIFFGGIKVQNIFITLLSVYDEIGNYLFLAYNLNLAIKGISKSLSHLIWYLCYIYGFWMIYVPAGYVLLSTLATIIELTGYILFYTLVDDEDIFIEIYEEKLPQKLVEEKNNNPNINISMGTPNYSNEELIIDSKYDTSTPYKDNYNFDEKIAKLEEENNMIKSDKRSLENEINSLRTANNVLKIKNEKLIQEKEQLIQENEKLIEELAKKETEIEKAQKGY